MKFINRWLHWLYQLSWKKVIGLSAFLLMVIMVPISIQVANNRTRTKSEAALIQPSPEAITTKFETPQGPPKIYLVDHFFGKAGDSVLIHGENLGGLHQQSSVVLSGKKISEDNLVSWTGKYIEFKVPANAISGRVEINILGQRTSWPGMFFVVDNTVLTEINLDKNGSDPNLAILTGTNLEGGKELLVWLLIVNAEGELKLTAEPGVSLTQTSFNLPLGKIYEVRLGLTNNLVQLLKVVKNDNQVVGIARAELSTGDGRFIPLKVNPLYVSF